jgi:thiamine phosphate synthase YjbQ (UPF0047 family)
MTKRGLTLVNAMHVTSRFLIRGDESDVHHDHDARLETLASASRRACTAIATAARTPVLKEVTGMPMPI